MAKILYLILFFILTPFFSIHRVCSDYPYYLFTSECFIFIEVSLFKKKSLYLYFSNLLPHNLILAFIIIFHHFTFDWFTSMKFRSHLVSLYPRTKSAIVHFILILHFFFSIEILLKKGVVTSKSGILLGSDSALLPLSFSPKMKEIAVMMERRLIWAVPLCLIGRIILP